MYSNDSLKFLLNGHYTEELFLTQGVKQGNLTAGIGKNYTSIIDFQAAIYLLYSLLFL